MSGSTPGTLAIAASVDSPLEGGHGLTPGVVGKIAPTGQRADTLTTCCEAEIDTSQVHERPDEQQRADERARAGPRA